MNENKQTFTLYSSDTVDNLRNTIYPHKHAIDSREAFLAAVRHDYVCATYKDNRRSEANFMSSDCLSFDCDNDHSDDPEAWVTPEVIQELFPGVCFAVHYSMNHMREKNGKAPRPKFHALFALATLIEDPDDYKHMKQQVQQIVPAFDAAALDAARVFRGTPDPQVEIYDGGVTIDALLKDGEEEEQAVIKEGERNTTMHRIACRLLVRLGDVDQAYESFITSSQRCEPPLPSAELETIWASASKFYKNKCLPQRQKQVAQKPDEPQWEEPIPFGEYSPTAFPVDALPDVIGRYVQELAESTQTPVDMAATCALAVLSVAMQGKFKIRAKEDWVEPVNLYVLNIMKPSERKSPVESAMTRPLDAYEKDWNEKHRVLIEASKMEKDCLEKKKKTAKTNTEILSVAEEIAGFDEIRPLKLYVDNITPEKLMDVLAENGGHAAILSAEGGIFDILSGAYSTSVNLDPFLKGYSGDTIRVDRISRAGADVSDPALTILLMAQPTVLSGIMSNRMFCGRGLTARFLYSVPKSHVGSRSYRSPSVREETSRAYDERIRNLLEDVYPAEVEMITLSPEADRLIGDFAEWLEPRLVSEHEKIAEWAGKLVGTVLRISALLCRASVVRGHEMLDYPEPLIVDDRTMSNAIRIGNYFLDHATIAHDIMGSDPDVNMARKALDALKGRRLEKFSRREIMRYCRSLSTVDIAQRALSVLTDYGYIAPKPDGGTYSGKGRPASQEYLVNPLVYESC